MLPQVFDDFPLFDESHRVALEKKIVKHFYFYEIGFETWGQFRFRFNEKLQEIMPYYNKRYESETLRYDPMNPTNITTTHNGSSNETSNNRGNTNQVSNGTQDSNSTTESVGNQRTNENGSSTTNSNASKNESGTSTTDKYYWETPQTQITDESYATTKSRDRTTNNADSTENKSQTTNDERVSVTDDTRTQKTVQHGESTGNVNTDSTNDFTGQKTDKYTTNQKGNAGIPGQDLLQKYRDVLLNIDMEIIYELKSCFMGVY